MKPNAGAAFAVPVFFWIGVSAVINGVMHIVAAVLFAVVYLFGEMGVLWLWIGAVYLVFGILNLVFYALRNRKKQWDAAKQVKAVQKEESAKHAELARELEAAKMNEPKTEV